MKNVRFCDTVSLTATWTDSLGFRAMRFQTFFIHPIFRVSPGSSHADCTEVRGIKENTAEQRSARSSLVVVGGNFSRERKL